MTFVYILLSLLVLTFLIFFHELGHFTVGKLLGFRILGGSGSGDVDRTARNALGRVRSIPGLSPSFLRACPVIEVRMTPVQGG